MRRLRHRRSAGQIGRRSCRSSGRLLLRPTLAEGRAQAVMTEMQAFTPKLPRLDQLDPERLAFDYDRPSDTLFLNFEGHPSPVISVVVTDDLLYLVDPVTEQVV